MYRKILWYLAIALAIYTVVVFVTSTLKQQPKKSLREKFQEDEMAALADELHELSNKLVTISGKMKEKYRKDTFTETDVIGEDEEEEVAPPAPPAKAPTLIPEVKEDKKKEPTKPAVAETYDDEEESDDEEEVPPPKEKKAPKVEKFTNYNRRQRKTFKQNDWSNVDGVSSALVNNYMLL
jgi:outer membrane biosynthesis protein TonB